MKLKIIVFVIFIICLKNISAQWQPDVQLTNNNAEDRSSLNNARWIVSQGSDVHIFWAAQYPLTGWEIWHKSSTDEGISWNYDNGVTGLPLGPEWYPSVCLSGSINPTIHLVWSDGRYAPNWEIYYMRSTDGGTSWGAEGRLTESAAYSAYPSIAVSGSTVHLVWAEGNAAHYKRSTDGGITWQGGPEGTQLSNSALTPIGIPSISVSGTFVHVVWSENEEIHYRQSFNDGASWGPVTQLTFDSAYSRSPCVSVSGQDINVAWHDLRDGNYEIYYKKSGDGGLNWEADKRLTNDIYYSYQPSVFASGSIIHVVWYDLINNYRILYKKSLDGGVNWGADVLLENSDVGGSHNPSITAFGTSVHVVWEDTRDGNSELYYTRNPSGNVTGINDIESEIPTEFLLSQNYPNPFNPGTRISWQMPVGSWQTLKVYDVLGNEIATLVDEYKPVGSYEVEFIPSSINNHTSSGVYFYQIKAGDYLETKKMLLIK